jgi:hypothetical protein
MSQLNALGGAIRYEFLMQGRRRALWIAYAVLGALVGFVGMQLATSPLGSRPYTHRDGVIEWTSACTALLALGAGLLLADRTRRDRTTQVDETLRTTPAALRVRFLGKYLGSVAATLLPILLIYWSGIAYLIARWHDLEIIPLAAAAFLALVVPPVLFAGAFSLTCTTLLWTPLYQFLFVGYWLWNGLNPAEAIPTLNNTLLSPTENYVVTGFFHMTSPYPQDALRYPASSVWLGLANIAALLAAGALALFAAERLVAWRASHQ